jgi:hypothetical protein
MKNKCLGNQFIEKIKARVFNLNLIKYAVDNMTKKVPPYFFPLFTLNEEGHKMLSFPLLDSKKYLSTKWKDHDNKMLENNVLRLP